MKILIRKSAFLSALLMLVLLNTGITAQTVTINLNVMPPYSPFYRDYAGFNHDYLSTSNTIVTLTSTSNVQIYLTASITKDDNSIGIKVKDNYRPGTQINLVANIPQVISGIQLKNIYGNGSSNDLVLTGITQREIMYNQALPEGNYNICVQARDYLTGNILGEDCKNIYVAYYEPPQIVTPVNLSSVDALTPQFVLINWTPVTPNVSGLSYRLRLVKIQPGFTATDALKNSSNVLLDKSNIPINTYVLDLSSGVILDTSFYYALQVTATSPNAYFKNNGASEPSVFYYKASHFLTPGANGITLNFIRPNAKKNIIETNNETPFLLSWNWFDINKNTDTLKIDANSYKNYGVVKYKLKIENANVKGGVIAHKNFQFIKEINETTAGLMSYVSLPQKTADSLGFVVNGWYKATVTAYNQQQQEVATARSVNFQYRKIADEEPAMNFSVDAVIKYMFTDSVGAYYNATNTPVDIIVLNKCKVPVAAAPTITVGSDKFVAVATKTGTTDAYGALHDKISVPLKVINADSIYLMIKMADKYYIDKSFPLMHCKSPLNDTMVNFGQLVAQTCAYSLKVYVKKAYTNYKISDKDGKLTVTLADSLFNSDEFPYQYSSENGGTMTYAVESKKLATDITMVIYRKNKQTYIPPIEGNITDYSHTSGFTEVGRAVTQIEKAPSGDVTYVKFDHLLASVFSGDEYYILALNGKNDPGKGTANISGTSTVNLINNNNFDLNLNSSNGTIAVSDSPYGKPSVNYAVSQQNPWLVYNTPYGNMIHFDDGFIAHEKLIKISLPKNINSNDSLYRNLKAEYDIVSTKPPTSLVKGKIMYHWKSDPGNQLRPYANQTFKVVVDYLVDGQPIGSIKSIKGNSKGYVFSEKFFVPEGQDLYSEGMELLDHDATMAIGKTDAQGNFEIEVVNVNQKGSLGKGYVVDKGWSFSNPDEESKPPAGFGLDDVINPGYDSNPWDGTSIFSGSLGVLDNFNQNSSVQNSINGGMNIGYNNSGGFFGVNMHNGNVGGGILLPGMNTPGPSSNYVMLQQPDPDLVNFERVYRIIPDNEYVYPSKETFAVQAFDALNIPATLTCYVKEIKLRVKSTDMTNNSLDQMLVTVFRDINDKTEDLPFGEGNGEYKYAELTSPQYNISGEPFDNANAKDLPTDANVFAKKYEQIWPATKDSAGGWVGFKAVLAGFEDYYVEVCSDPTGNKTYKATFASVPYNVDTYNPDYWLGIASPPTVEVKIKLQPLPSRALIRLIDNSTQNYISGAQGGRVTIKKTGYSQPYSTFVDNFGYIEFLANKYPLSDYPSPVKFEGSATGYKPAASNSTVNFTFNLTGSQFFYQYLLDPSLKVQGNIVNMDVASRPGVPSYIKITGGKVIETDGNGNFYNLPVPAIAGTKILIIPKDVGFFDSVYTVSNADITKTLINIKDFGVYRRKHRIRFTITNTSNNALANASIALGDSVRKTNYLGKTSFVFENVSVNNFTFMIRGPEGQNYIPKTLTLKNEESNQFVDVAVKLESGSLVQGKVLLDGKPVKHAKIYIDVSQQNSFLPIQFHGIASSNDANLVVAYSDAMGNYKLRGIPMNNQTITLHATLDTNFTVNGDIKPVQITNHNGTCNFSLSSFRKMLVNNLYGFPLSVEKIIPLNADSTEVNVSGVVYWSKAISNFQLNETNQQMRVENVRYGERMVNGKKVAVPLQSTVSIDGITSLKFTYLGKYNVKLQAVQPHGLYDPFNPQPLAISKENDLGVIKGSVSIVDNSFNFPSTYLNFSSAVNNFFLAEKINDNTVNTEVSAITSAMTETQTNTNYYSNFSQYLSVIQTYINGHQPNVLYNLSNQQGKPIKFKLIEFDASANPLKSFISSDGKIHLNVDLQCHIPNAQPEDFSLNIDDMVLDNNKVYPATSASPVKLTLEKWNLIVKDWSFSTQEGGIVSNNGLINTSAVDIPFTKFVLRHDLFYMDNFQLGNLKMAGGNISLQVFSTQNAGLVFDNKTGTDMKPHWRFSISGNPAAQLPQLTDLSGIIKLNYIQILSNNESVFQLKQQSAPSIIKNNPLAKFSPESIYNGPDYISISGALDVGAPRMAPIALDLLYKNISTLKLQTVQTDFEGQGFVHFVARNPGNDIPNITITKQQISILGNVIEKPTPTFNEIPSTFYAVYSGSPFYTGGNPVYKVEMDKNFVTQLTKSGNASSSNGYKLTISNGGMSVSGNDWSILTYEGMMESNEANSSTKPLFAKYSVLGDISADASGMEVSNINTPFGSMKMVFDFAKKRMIGTITAKDIPLGTSKLTGTVETLFDPDGFYVAGGCVADVKLPNPYVDGTYNMGFMVGSYPITNPLWDVVNSYKNPNVKNNCYRKKNPKLTGFYFTIDRVIVDKSIDFDFILASGYLHATALLGADIYANFSPFTVGVEAHAFAQAAAGLGSITGTSISGSLDALALLKFVYENDAFHANGSIDLGFKASITQSLIATTISKSISISCHAAGGTDGFSFSLGSGDPRQDCAE